MKNEKLLVLEYFKIYQHKSKIITKEKQMNKQKVVMETLTEWLWCWLLFA